jgi:dihydropteroate synthase
MKPRASHCLEWNGNRLELGGTTAVMGIVNVTPDSFSDGGRFFATEGAVAQGEKLAEEGADILDVGGESTRPFSDPVGEEEEIRRVVPVIEALSGRVGIPLSVDTTKAAVARRALEAGAAMVNDVSAGRLDPDILTTAAASGVPLVLMHMLGVPRTMQKAPEYGDLFGEILGHLQAAVDRATAAGVDRSRIIVDPGIGFGKTTAHNLKLIAGLHAFSALGCPVMVGASRKAFIRKLTCPGEGVDADPLSHPVETGSQAAVTAAVLNGAHIVRVHDVANTLATVRVADAIRKA